MSRPFNLAVFGARPGWLGLACFFILCSFPGHFVAAAEPDKPSIESSKRFASVWRIQGDVYASGGASGPERLLREGDPVSVGNRIRTAASAEAVLKTEDAGFVAIRPNAEFIAESFAAEDKLTDHFTLRLILGSLRVITGWTGRTNQAGHRIVTPSVTLGIRGTDHEPFVLSPELAAATSSPEGTYDKVNRGGTTMMTGGQTLDINPGQVGFVRATGSHYKTRALLTILLPVLLDKVPDFFVPGQFDAELDRYSKTADEDSLGQLEQRRKAANAPPSEKCVPIKLAKAWLRQLDGAIARNDAPAIVALFAPEVSVRASVRGNDSKMTTIDLGREELAQSTLAAVQGLKDYKQRRVSIEAKLAGPATEAVCDHVSVKSVVIEQGQQSGKRFRFESLEEYLLELRSGKWLATRAETTQH